MLGGRSLFSTSYSSTAVTLQGTLIVVNSTGDSGQSGSGTPHTGNTVNGNPEITLRSAIQYANSLSGTSYIDFDIPTSDANYSSGTWTIAPHSALPTISEPVILNAETQTGYSTPVIALSGVSAGVTNGLTVATGGDGSTIEGFNIASFGSGSAIELDAGGNLIEGNFIGTDITGTTTTDANNHATGNGQGNIPAIEITGAKNTIGGTTATPGTGAGNLISGNGGAGVGLTSSATGNLVEGNLIGTDINGTSILTNYRGGVSVAGSANTIGGTTTTRTQRRFGQRPARQRRHRHRRQR